MNNIKYLLSIAGGAVLTYFKLYGPAYIIVGAAVLFDIVTGILASIMDGAGLSSQKAYKGVIKKIVLFVALAFGTFLDVFIPYAAASVNMSIPKNLLFSSVICVYIAVTESISIIENIYRCNNQALPAWIAKFLKAAKDDLDSGENAKGGKEK